ncbi:MAG: hypothetical protein VYA51_12935 [Planctomycetota bacterium]|nr:hypothetical protein [Planctomycetota bacterium]
MAVSEEAFEFCLNELEARTAKQARRRIAWLRSSLDELESQIENGGHIHSGDSSAAWNELHYALGELSAARRVQGLRE